ncbi:RNase adapter RapZ [Maridesulfovibrio ferrireducens]|uniref:RNase adapter RapZ n=1 Tax=Maridesulfovibrio ferrireducens TaxID=246191 RepID=UPI001A34E0AB|nr:RNase adapter RapZ [Maridesulfovibrio ferrireducens]MBI9111677.1 RNase adapter RapZ [Maridesulfovibrio ferrireducens]
MESADSFPVIVVSGLSGAGKSTVLKVFEDLRFFCVDGLPASMLARLVELFKGKDENYRGLVLGMDLRQQDFVDDWQSTCTKLGSSGVCPSLIFLEARLPELVRRYATTRRPHPLESKKLGLEQALEEEKILLEPLRMAADLVIDTTTYSIHDLRRRIQEKWSELTEGASGLRVNVISFGFKHDVPTEADMVMDLRFLPNPYFDEELRPFSGRDKAISDYVLGSEPGSVFIEKYLDFLQYILPLYEEEGRYRLTIAVGCTGGRHRSVAVAERIFATLKNSGYSANLEHKHINLK